MVVEKRYVHGYSPREADRLHDQAGALEGLVHDDVRYAAGRRVLECGCGAGAQTRRLVEGSPGARFVSVDLSAASVRQARAAVAGLPGTGDGASERTSEGASESASQRATGGVGFALADAFALPFPEAAFDDAFVCFVLEHLVDPIGALAAVRRVLRPGGTITVTEGDHGSWYAHPQTPEATRAVQCLVEVQTALGGDGLIGRRLYPILVEAGYRDVRVSPRVVYVDDSRPDLVEGFSRNTFIAMVEGARDAALRMGLVDEESWETGIADLYRATDPGGTFCYTFFRGTAVR